jgi:TetR/AcrR family transcriptional regulator, regulator of biofilm formation and stress response
VTVGTPQRGTSTSRGEARRLAILEATLTLIGKGGSAAITHRAVAEEAGVPLAATTYYFASKDDLVRCAFALAVEDDVAALRLSQIVLDGESPTPKAVAGRLAQLLTSRLGDERSTLLVQYELELEAARRPELAEMSRAWMAAYVEVITPALEALGSPSPSDDAWLLITSIGGVELELLASNEPQPDGPLQHSLERLLTALTQDA